MSQVDNELFKPTALKRISEIIGERYKGWQLDNFFSNAGYPGHQHDGRSSKWFFVNGVLHQVQDADGMQGVLRIIEQLCDPQEYFAEPNAHREVLKEVNNVLRFFGLVVKENGKITTTDRSDSFLTEMKENYTSSPNKVNVLAAFANPRSTTALRLGSEDRTIQEAIQLSRYRDNISLKICHAVTIDDLRRALLNGNFQIVHISGHGTSDGLIFETLYGAEYSVPQAALAKLLGHYSPPIGCVILNACYSISQAELISSGVPFTIAMDGSIDDDAAIEFSKGFYDAIGAGKGIEVAYEQGLLAVELNAPNTEFFAQLFISSSSQHLNVKELRFAPAVSSRPMSPNSNSDNWQASLSTKLNEFSTTWTFLYGKDREKLLDPFLSALKMKFTLISEQIITLLAACPQSTPKGLIEDIGNVAKNMSNLGHKQFYVDGGKSVEEFDSAGDNIAKNIEALLVHLNSGH